MARETKHTPGKWSVADYGHCIAVEVKLDNGQEHTIMTDQFCHAAKFNGDAMANARLIAEAPAMYDLLRQYAETIGVYTPQQKQFNSKVLELIKKIEG